MEDPDKTPTRQPYGPASNANRGFGNRAVPSGGIALNTPRRRTGTGMKSLQEEPFEGHVDYTQGSLQSSLLNSPYNHSPRQELPPYCTPSRASTATTRASNMSSRGSVSSSSPAMTGDHRAPVNVTPTRVPSRGINSSNWRATAGPSNASRPANYQVPGQQAAPSTVAGNPPGKLSRPASRPPLSDKTVQPLRHRSVSRLSQQSSPGMAFGQLPVQHGRPGTASTISESSTASPVLNGSPFLQAIHLQAPGKVVSIAEEIKRPGADPRKPHFLVDIPYMNNFEIYKHVVLPIVARSVFVIASRVELEWFTAMLNCNHFPGLRNYITKVYFSGFYWFGGISYNIRRNPMIALLDEMPNVTELGLTFHTAGLTSSFHSERDRLSFENSQQFDKSKQLKVMRKDQVANRYGLQDLFQLRNLQVLRLECIKSKMVAAYCRASDPLSVFNDVGNWLKQGYSNQNGDRQIVVTMTPLDLN
ncbi:hypothetical protein K491DRAFT_722582 [Lophiostoma macrostomum CBS 122681]|uniref:Uncharacterized protein n=1 Tax=Lophiostoma macrostomum CBS 122681 TaxID=1314788 RepID=A0A6A6SLR9_9PLEO|nr:hypothetical protein K491DRAFT_722582 [Lophiostoma macrostomum CBS 122681]